MSKSILSKYEFSNLPLMRASAPRDMDPTGHRSAQYYEVIRAYDNVVDEASVLRAENEEMRKRITEVFRSVPINSPTPKLRLMACGAMLPWLGEMFSRIEGLWKYANK